MNLIVVGINHRTAQLDIRERYAVATGDLGTRYQALMADAAIQEAVILSTCNRVEIYALVDPKATTEATSTVKRALGPGHPGVYSHAALDAVRHLFRVSASLDSMILGEPQILGQVKEAFAFGQEAGAVGPGLQACFSRAFNTAKRVRTRTGIARSAVSVGYVAVELAKTIFDSVDDISVLLVGAGKMGVLAAKNLSDSGARRVMVTNRTFERSQKLADRFGWSASAYGDLPLLLQVADVVICSTGSPIPVLTHSLVKAAVKKRRYRPLFLIDIAVPRDIAPECGELDDVYLYNIDDLEDVSRTNASVRQEAAHEAEELVGDAVTTFQSWSREREAAPTIKALREALLEIARAETEKTLDMLSLDDKSADTVRKLAEVIVSRVLRTPIKTLKEAAKAGRKGDDLARAAAELFQLERDDG
jgi:glutamyl-tRNA reductase